MNLDLDIDDLFPQIALKDHMQYQFEQKVPNKSLLQTQNNILREYTQDIHNYFSDQFLSINSEHKFSYQTNDLDQIYDKNVFYSQNSIQLENTQILNSQENKQIEQQQQIQSSISSSQKKLKQPDSHRNQTKNIPKNFGKAIISFIQRQKNITRKVLQKYKSGKYKQLMEYLQNNRKQIISIADVRGLWIDNQYEKVLRVLSELFLRKYSLRYIFNSRITNHNIHIKYKERFLKALRDPNQFKHIKQY